MEKRFLPSLPDIKRLIGANAVYALLSGMFSGLTRPSSYPAGAANNIAAGTGGAISITNYLTTVNADAGGDAFTLAAGSHVGQMKKILLVATAGGTAVVTGAFTGGGTLTITAANSFAVVMWNGETWDLIDRIGAVISA